jgi:hypothetical protein
VGQQTFVFQSFHGQPQRRAGYADGGHQLQFGHALAGAQVASQDHVAQPEDGAQHLGGRRAALPGPRAGVRARRSHGATAYQRLGAWSE